MTEPPPPESEPVSPPPNPSRTDTAEGSTLEDLHEEWDRLDAAIRAHLGDRYDLDL